MPDTVTGAVGCLDYLDKKNTERVSISTFSMLFSINSRLEMTCRSFPRSLISYWIKYEIYYVKPARSIHSPYSHSIVPGGLLVTS
jgi:hypothetical protein